MEEGRDGVRASEGVRLWGGESGRGGGGVCLVRCGAACLAGGGGGPAWRCSSRRCMISGVVRALGSRSPIRMLEGNTGGPCHSEGGGGTHWGGGGRD